MTDTYGHQLLSKAHKQGRQDIKLLTALDALKPRSKQAMYAAATAGTIKQGTWDGCAWNAAGKIEGMFVQSTINAAEAFSENTYDVQRFILAWDQLSVKNPTQTLIDSILQIGLFTEPYSWELDKATTRIIERVYTSAETKMKEEFDTLVESLSDLDSLDESTFEQEKLLNDVAQAKELLSV